jgi:hypothetical protein
MSLEAIHEQIFLDKNGCWVWVGALTTKGYGTVSHEGRKWAAHRLVYTLIKGEIPAGLQLDHLCRVRHCVNPDHLEPVTGKENIRRSPIHHGAKTRCKQGHPFTAENTGINKIHGVPKRRFCRTCQRDWNRAAAAKRRARREEAA